MLEDIKEHNMNHHKFKYNPNYREGRPRRKITPHYKAIYDYLQNHTYTEKETKRQHLL